MLLVRSERVRTDDPISSNVRYTGEIVRIFERRCLHCHGNDGLAMPLTNYRDVRAWGRAIREEIVEQRMPPWSAARGYGRFQNELALTAREATTLLSWVDGGMPRGDDRDLPVTPRPSNSSRTAIPYGTPRPPDLHLTVPPQDVPALEDHVVRRVSVDTNLDVERAVERLVVNPGNRRVLRAAFVFAGDPDRDGQWMAAWLPWQRDIVWPAGSSTRLGARARLTAELHYRGDEKDLADQPSIDVFYATDKVGLTASAPPPREALRRGSPKAADVPGAAEGGKATASLAEARFARRRKPDATYAKQLDELAVWAGAPLRIARDTTVWAMLPSADASGTSLELTARRPNGATDVLMWIPEFRREWPQAFLLEDPITLPAGTRLALVSHPSAATARVRLSVLR